MKKFVDYICKFIILNPFQFFKNLIRFIFQYKEFKEKGGLITSIYPILRDYKKKAGTASGAYFHQDLLVASFIFDIKPKRHIDIGSRIDGFVAHVASYRLIEIMDIRALSKCNQKNIHFLQCDLMSDRKIKKNITDSISCLHAIEHFGLGRYGDQIDPNGHIKGLNNILKMLKRGGTLYISFPIASSNHIFFNAHRIFKPKDIFNWIDKNTLKLKRFDYVDSSGNLFQKVNINSFRAPSSIGCGIYTFKKL